MIENEDAFDALQDVHRRRLLVCLLDGEPVPVSKLTAETREMADANAAVVEEFLSGHREFPGVDKDVLREHHRHLPKLVAYGFIEWDEDAHDVTRGARFDEIRPLLEVLSGDREELSAEEVVVSVRG